ncbi:GNAT family N-acetyltransferase [Actinokineospora sp. NBRC 105648]|uniref:GNAT family N-acetyltransferase n=1 Tax=Actinokineospora sp. NBRC 105648 TaxID=3032206 RepID=UPI0024A4D7F5|nr:GNAT family N-acetyltransferase [Actinokineospora sp. NBRC 105648]GLZ41794.1 UPF0256 protein [Actinokineospora sp. NBRC 105648]
MVVIRPFSEEDADEVYRLRRLSFGGPAEPPADWPEPAGAWQGFVGELDSAIAGFLRVYAYRQFFGGVAVPMGGIASVCVYPHARGSGIAGALLEKSLHDMRERGQPVSTLFPYVLPIYRRYGWEHVGTADTTLLPLAELAATPRATAPVRPATTDDLSDLHACYLRSAAKVDGMLDRSAPVFDLAAPLRQDVATVVPGEHGIRGYLTAKRPDGEVLKVLDLVADDVDAAHALLRQLASWAGGLSEATIRVIDRTLLDLVVPSAMRRSAEVDDFMLRVVDLPAAIAARGWPAVAYARSFSVDVEVVDQHAPWQAGRWRLTHEAGTVICERGGEGAVQLSARALGPWYAGSATTASLRQAGFLSGGHEAAAALDALTGAPHHVHIANVF